MNLRGRNKITPEFNMSSMTDIVFLLLIFFMIASTLAKQLETIDVQLPQAKGKTENRNTVTVSILKGGVFYVDQQKVTKAALAQTLQGQLVQMSVPSLVIRAEKSVALDEVVYVMNWANQNGVKVVLAVENQ
ncbi:MAG: ExbD/TolR family protein [Flavobacteriaceae bacterium]